MGSGWAVLFFCLLVLYFFTILLSFGEQLEDVFLFDGAFLVSSGHKLVDRWMRIDEYFDLVFILNMFQFLYVLFF